MTYSKNLAIAQNSFHESIVPTFTQTRKISNVSPKAATISWYVAPYGFSGNYYCMVS